MTREAPSEIHVDRDMAVIGLLGAGLSGFVMGMLIMYLIAWVL